MPGPIPLPPTDEHSDEATLELPVWRNRDPHHAARRRGIADAIRAGIGPQTTSSIALVREDRDR